MPFTLLVGPGTESPHAAVEERSFDKPIVTIGRAATCDLILKDVRRAVSSRHAEIRRKDDHWVLVDTRSTNGTFLNDRRIPPDKECPLTDGDCIGVGGFVLTFRTSLEVSGPHQPSGAAPGTTFRETPGIAGDETVDRLAYLLRQSYSEGGPSGDDERVPEMAELLRQNVRSLRTEQARAMIHALKRKFAVSNPDRITTGGQVPQPPLRSQQKEIREIGSVAQLLSAIVGRYCPTLAMPLSPEDSARALTRMARVLEVTFKSLADALKGRREFQRELEVDATRILSWSPNLIKCLETEQEIGRALLDPRGSEIVDERLEGQLREVFQDLLLHQIGLLAGMQECLRGLLKEFAPSTFEGEKPGLAGKQSAPFFERAQMKKSAEAWKAFKEKHEKFSEEEVKLFETILAPYFARGYLAVQKTKPRK
ncbi:MAG: type VI secretion system-associated FHA domain protein TagH [Nitrospiraceae bacterium]